MTLDTAKPSQLSPVVFTMALKKVWSPLRANAKADELPSKLNEAETVLGPYRKLPPNAIVVGFIWTVMVLTLRASEAKPKLALMVSDAGTPDEVAPTALVINVDMGMVTPGLDDSCSPDVDTVKANVFEDPSTALLIVAVPETDVLTTLRLEMITSEPEAEMAC